MDLRDLAEALPMPGDRRADAVSRPESAVHALRFDGFEFDLRRGELQGLGGIAIPLRPKAESLLRQFLAHPGRLLSKDELMAAVWPAAVVTDDSLVQCVGELRTALDDHAQRVIRTVPRRGYRFEAAVAPLRVAAPAPVTSPVAGLQPHDTVVSPSRRSRESWRLVLAALGVVAAIGGAVALYLTSTSASINIDEVMRSRATVAVMTPVVATSDSALRSIADAVADGITTQLATRMGMRGIDRAATVGFDGASPPLQRIASELKATHVATVRAAPGGAEGRFSLDVQLTAVANGETFWARRFEGVEAGAEQLATRVGQHVAIAIRRRGPKEASLRAAQPGHTPDAADLTSIGWGDLDARQSLADVRRARGRFEAALRDDPRSAIALTGLSTSYLFERSDPLSQLTPQQVAEHERVTELAIKQAPDNDTALVVWGQMQVMQGRPDLALLAFEKANRMVPSQPSGYVQVATARMLLGRADEVQALADRAVELGAGDARRVGPAYLIAAEAALLSGEDDRARDLAQRAVVELPSNSRAHATLAAIEALTGRDGQARLEMAACLKLWPTATLARYDELRPSTHPLYLAQRERLYEGLLKAGLPQR